MRRSFRGIVLPTLAIALAATALVRGQDGGAARRFADGRLSVVTTASAERARPGDVLELRFDLDVKEGFHVYAPTSPSAAPAFELKAEKGSPFALEGPLAGTPAPKVEEAPGLGTTHTYSGKARYVQKIKVLPGAASGTHKLDGQLSLQACDEKSCVPDDVTVAFSIAVEPAPQGGLGFLLAFAVGSGLLTLLLPCTYPMVPITISIFSKGKTLPRGKAIGRAAIYASGIVISFTLIGGLIQVLLGSSGQSTLNAIATNGWLNLAVGAVFVYFAFSFFGFYEIALPGPLQRALDRATSGAGGGGDGGVPASALFLMGSFFVLTTYTCGAPLVLGVILQGATTPNPVAIIGATAVFGTTVALPFFALALVPSFLKALPRGGGWFDVFKTILGFLEVAFAFKFLRTTDVAFELHVISRPVLLGVWVACAGLCVVYLFDWLKVRHEGEEPLERLTLGRVAWAFVFLFVGIYLASGLGGRKLAGQIEAFMLASADEDATAQAAPEPGSRPAAGSYRFGRLDYGRSFEDALARARAEKRPVFVMFTGHT